LKNDENLSSFSLTIALLTGLENTSAIASDSKWNAFLLDFRSLFLIIRKKMLNHLRGRPDGAGAIVWPQNTI